MDVCSVFQIFTTANLGKMTTAARPTFEPAKGGRGKGEGDLSALSKQYSSRDLPGHTKIKYRSGDHVEPSRVVMEEVLVAASIQTHYKHS